MKALAKQIAGRKKVVFDDTEAQKDYATLKALQKDLRGLQVQLDALSKSAEAYAGDGKQTLDLFENLGPKWQKEGFEDVSRVVRGSVGLLRQSQSLGQQLEQEVEAHVTKPLRDLNDNEFAKAKQVVKKTQEMRAAYQDTVVTMERERKKGKVTALDAENQTKRAAADYEVAEAECKKVMRSAIESAQTFTITMACNYLRAYGTFWDQGAKTRELLAATAAKHRAVAAERAERLRVEENRVIKVFGVSLDEVVRRDGQVPQFVFDLINHIATNGINEEGIFRVPGNMEALTQLKKKIDSGVASSLLKEIQPHDAAGLLKLYFRELPTPLIPYAAYDEFVKVDVRHIDRASVRADDSSKRVQIMAILGRLPVHVHKVLKELVYMCTLLASKSSVNKMDAANLARSLAPGLMRNDTGGIGASVDLAAALASSHSANDLLEHLIKEYAVYFERSLHALAASGTVEAMRQMLALPSLGAGALGRDDTGKTVLHYAAAKGRTEMCQFLLESHPEAVSLQAADSEGNTALHLAVMDEHLDTAAFLVYRGASMETMNKSGQSVFALAALVSPECAKTIRDKVASLARGKDETPSRKSREPLKKQRASGYVEEQNATSPALTVSSSVASSASASSSTTPALTPTPTPSAEPPAASVIAPAQAPPPRPKVRKEAKETKEATMTAGSSSEEVMQALQQPAPALPRRVSLALSKSGSASNSPPMPEKAVVMQAPQVRASIARALSTRLSQQADPNHVLWTHVTPESFCEISPLTDAVLTFAALVCDASRAGDAMAVRQSLKDVARGLQTFFKSLDALTKPFEQDDAEAVRAVAARLKDCATQLLAVVREISAGDAGKSQPRLELQAFRLATVTLELFDVVELGRYRIVNLAMQRTAEEAAALTKAVVASEVSQHRQELKQSAVVLASAVVCKALKLAAEEPVARLLKLESDFLVMVRDIRHPDATPSARGQLAKSIILSFRAVKTAFKEADEATMREPRSDVEVLDRLCSDLMEIRAPDDYVPESRNEGALLEAVADLHDVLLAKRLYFGQWRLFAAHYEAVAQRVARVGDAARRILERLREGDSEAARVSFFLNALAFHQARITLVVAHASVLDHNSQPERDESLRAVVYPTLEGPTRPALAFAGLVTLLLQFVPLLFKAARTL